MASLTFVCGAECQLAVAGASGLVRHWDAVGGTPTADTTIKRNGLASYRFNPTSAVWNLSKTIATTRQIGRIAIYFTTLPNISTQLIRFVNASGNLVIGYNTTGTKLVAVITGGTEVDGPSITTGVWYVIDFDANSSGATATVDWQVDAAPQTQATRVQASANMTAFFVGIIGNAVSTDEYIDDIALSQTGADYPLGDGKVLGFVPNADGTHSFTLTNFKYNAAGADIATDATDVYSYIDELPVDGGADFINQLTNEAAGYVEVAFEDTAETANARGIEVVSAHHSATTSTSRQTLNLNDGGTLGAALNDGSPASITPKYNSTQFTTAPSGGAWTQAKINALKARWGYSGDANPDTYLDCVMLEIEWAVAAVTAIADTIQPIWNVRMYQADSVKPVWNVKSELAKAGQYIWNVLSGVSIADAVKMVWNTRRQLADSVKPVWNVRARLAKSGQYIWNIKTVLARAEQYLWNVRQSVADAVVLKWNVRAFLSDSVKAVWNVLSGVKVTDTLKLVWNARFALTQSVKPVWNIRARLVDSVNIIWNVLTTISVADTIRLIWNVRGQLATAIRPIWNVKAFLSDSLQTIWNVRITLSDSMQAIWNIRTTLTDSLNTIWNTRAYLADSMKAVWNVLSGVRITDAIGLVWNVRQFLASSTRTIWNVLVTAVTPPVEVPTPMRVPSVRIAPMVYRDILQGWMEPWSYYGVETLGKRTKAMARIPQLRNICVDCQRMTERVCASAIVGFHISDIFKGKELFMASATFETETLDKLTFGRERKLLIALNDKKLGIDTEEE